MIVSKKNKLKKAVLEHDLTDHIESAPVEFSKEFTKKMENLIKKNRRFRKVINYTQKAVIAVVSVALFGSLMLALLLNHDTDIIGSEHQPLKTLRILAPKPPEHIEISVPPVVVGSLHHYISRFKTANRGVEVEVEYYAEDWSYGRMGEANPTMPQLTALMTRLLSDPPDLFIFDSNTVVFEKIDPEALFVDLNKFMDGPGGIDRDDYFDNIFRAMEHNGALYSVTSQVLLEMILLNRDLFSLIGVDADKIDAVSMGELLEYFERISLVYDDSYTPLAMYSAFAFPEVLLHEALYSVEDGTVNVNTPVMRERLESALRLTEDGGFASDSYDRGRSMVTLSTGNKALDHHNLIYRDIRSFAGTTAIFLQNTPDMRFTTPVHLLNDNGEKSFFTGKDTFSIMSQSNNQELAWEFIKFVLEIRDGSQWEGYSSWQDIPVNRARFNSRFNIFVPHYWDFAEDFDNISRYLNDSNSSRSSELTKAKDFFTKAMEQFNHQYNLNWSVYISLIHPDLWLLYSGQHDVAQTLENIQRRLELYVSE